jgi:ligand-binding SRPBCC domain-containing protein
VRTIELVTPIRAPPLRCFDLSRSIDLHLASAKATAERAVAGVTTGLIGLGEEVTWEARHLGVRQHLTSRIEVFEPPRRFRDVMVRGPFARFEHEHLFASWDGHTEMRDVLSFAAPGGPLGRLAEPLLAAYLRHFLAARNEVIRRVAESDEWRTFLPA